MTADPLPPLRNVISRFDLSARKGLGQNFLLDLNITRKIARNIPGLATSQILEIGPGPGGLTRALLLEGAKKVTAIEKDKRFAGALREIKAAYPARFDYLLGDALELDQKGLFNKGEIVQIAANLPYNVATKLLSNWLEEEPWPPFYTSATVMVQREVAERFMARAHEKAYGRLAVLGQWRARPGILFHLPSSAFVPAPKVSSSVIQFVPKEPVVKALDGPEMGRFTRVLFSKRRKTLRNVLKPLGGDFEVILEKEKIDPGLRAEALSVPQICSLALALKGRF